MILTRAQASRLIIILVALCLMSSPLLGYAETSKTWNFDAVPPGTLPDNFRLGRLYDGRPAGQW